MFELQELPFAGCYVIQGRIFKDERGEFHKKIHQGFFESHGLEWQFTEQYYSTSRKDVVRGMHFQKPPFDHVKLIYCTSGLAQDVLLDLRKNSKTYKQCFEVRLQGGDGKSLYLPKGIAHGFRSLSDHTTIMYSVTVSYEPWADVGVLWNSIPYNWGIEKPLISARDLQFPTLDELDSPF